MSTPDSTPAARQRVIVFTRFPRAGQTKTRLIPALGADGAAELQRRLTEHVLARLAPLIETDGVALEIRYDDATKLDAMRRWLATPGSPEPASVAHDDEGTALTRALRDPMGAARLTPQGPGDLGQRMLRAFSDATREGAPATVIVGSDVPALAAAHIRQTLAALDSHDVVLGPALDSGYYLIALTRPLPEIFRDVAWGSAEVLPTTLRRVEQAGLRLYQLRPLADIDRPEDLHLLDDFADLREFAPPDDAA